MNDRSSAMFCEHRVKKPSTKYQNSKEANDNAHEAYTYHITKYRMERRRKSDEEKKRIINYYLRTTNCVLINLLNTACTPSPTVRLIQRDVVKYLVDMKKTEIGSESSSSDESCTRVKTTQAKIK